MAAPRKIVVEIFGARNLVSIDETGPASAFCTLDYDQSQKKSTTKSNDLSPTWGEQFDFPYGNGLGVLDINVYNEREGGTRQDGFLGRVQIKVPNVKKQGQGALKWLRLETKSGFAPIQNGELGVHVWYEDLKSPPPEPKLQPKPPEPKEPPPPKKEAKPRFVNKVTPAEFKVKDVVRKTGETALDHEHNNDAIRKSRETALDHQHSNDLVEPMMQYLYVKVVEARNLAAKGADGSSDPYVQVHVGDVCVRTQVIRKDLNPEWHRVFAFSKDKLQGQFLEISVWGADIEDETDHFLGALSFLREETPIRKPPESPLAPLWYKLEERPGKTVVKGDLKVALWMGNHDDEAFQDASQPDPDRDLDFGGQAHLHLRPKVYRSPTMWYLRVCILETEDLYTSDAHTYRCREPIVEINLGLVQTKRIVKVFAGQGHDLVWNKELLFVAAEPFDELLVVTVKDRVGPNKEEVMGLARISLGAVPRRLDFRQQMDSAWFILETTHKGVYGGRIRLRAYFEGGYHVLDEAPDSISCTRPSAEQPGIASLGTLDLGIIGAYMLLPMHNIAGGRGVTDAYCVAKYGQTWFRTSTILDRFSPKWNEQYTWEIYDPFTVLTVCIFDNRNVHNHSSSSVKDTPIGKIKIRLSNLEINRVYNARHPLLVVTASGIKKLGELELSVRFSCASTLNVMRAYLRAPLPALHYSAPIEWSDSENLLIAAMNMVASRLARFKHPLRLEVIQFMLDTQSNRFSMRRSKANYLRILDVIAPVFAVHKWFDDICKWKSPMTTVLVHVFCLVLVWYPELRVPIVFLSMFLVGVWNYPFRSRPDPPLIDEKLSGGGSDPITDLDELEEEFNVVRSNKVQEALKKRYERLRGFAGRIQNFVSAVSTQGERLQSLLSWRDRRATFIFVIFCLIAAIVHYITPLRLVAQVLIIFYILRHPKFRDPFPSIPLNFFRHLPSLSDGIL